MNLANGKPKELLDGSRNDKSIFKSNVFTFDLFSLFIVKSTYCQSIDWFIKRCLGSNGISLLLGADFIFPFPQTAGHSLPPTRQDWLRNRITVVILWWLEEPEPFRNPTPLSHLELLPLSPTPSIPVIGC